MKRPRLLQRSYSENDCCICGIELKGWIYYQKAKFKICHFCYKGLEMKGDD